MTALIAGACLLAALPVSFAHVPVYIEDSHAGSFYWLIDHLEPDQIYHLVLFDHHSDATEVLDSDRVRRQAERARALRQTDSLASDWRTQGTIQCFNWVEPLMPAPVGTVTWVAAPSLSADELDRLTEEAAGELNCHESAMPRACGDLASRFTVTDFARQSAAADSGLPTIVSIDLDYFTGWELPEARRQMHAVLDYVLGLRDLQAITCAISRSYLESDEQASHLLGEFIAGMTNTVNTDIEFAPFARCGPDRSRQAKALLRQHRTVPVFDATRVSRSLRSLLVQSSDRLRVNDGRLAWDRLLESWCADSALVPAIGIELGKDAPAQETCCVRKGTDFTVRLRARPGFRRVCWKAVVPAVRACNIIRSERGFSLDARRFVRFQAVEVKQGRETQLGARELERFFDARTGLGTVRVFAKLDYGNETYRTNTVRIARIADTTYPGRLTELFNLPYVYGSSLLGGPGASGADLRQGSDCSNFIIYGKRYAGADIPYCDPAQLREYLRVFDRVSGFDDGRAVGSRGAVAMTQAMIDTGLVLHFGTHVAAVYQDLPPKGVLDAGDLVIHQLEDFAEIVPLGTLTQSARPFDVMTFRP